MTFGVRAGVSTRRMPRTSMLILLLSCALPFCECVGAYARMENDRILLMNNDTRSATLGKIANQGYYDTNSTIGVTYWTHEPQGDNTRVMTRYLLHGTNHVLHAADGRPLWHLVDCRAGYVQSGNASRNYIPWSSYAQRSDPPVFRVDSVRYYTNEVNACVFMRNTPDAVIYSPYYEEGIGTIYADVVNSYVRDSCTIVLEIATNVTAVAAGAGVTFSTAGTDYDKYDWQQTPMTVLSVENGNIASISDDVEILTLDATEGGTTHYFRIRTQLNYYAPIRFRIRRTSHNSGEDADTSGLIALDNIIASYPPMTIRLERYGEDYDTSLKGAEVLGCMGDFNVPFLSTGAKGVRAKAKFSWVTNNADVSQKIELSSPQFHYRWRYLNQMADDWKVLPLTPTAPSYLVDNTATQLVSEVDIPLNQGAGDIEYFFTADVDAQYYAEQDYANDVAVGFGDGWTEKISAVTNRATYTETDRLPSCGTDYFTRVREGESNVGWVQLVGTLTVTNKVAGSNEVVRLHTPDGTAPRMTLVGDHIWRYHYQIPTNGVGGTLAFRLVTKEHYTNETDTSMWLVRTNNLYTIEGTITEIPYTDTLSMNNPNEISVVLDDASTHLKIEYNDESCAFTLSHATYQDFNMWADARQGFRSSGASNNKMRYDAPFPTWRLCPEYNNYWHEKFNIGTGNLINRWFPICDTPNNWTAYNGRFVGEVRGDSANLALALDGRREGALAVDNVAKDDLPLGLDSVEFTARIAQPVKYEDFATYRDGNSFRNYAISAMVTMSQQYERYAVTPIDMPPNYPSISFVGYHRGKQGCYEFRMTRTGEYEIELALYKWTSSGSSTEPILLASKIYTTHTLVPTSANEMNDLARTAAYFLVYTLDYGAVKLEGHLSSTHTPLGSGVQGTENGLNTSAISFIDMDPGVLVNGGTYGVGSADCRASFGAICHHGVVTAPTASTDAPGDAVIAYPGTLEGRKKLEDNWNYYTSRWEVDPRDPCGGMLAAVPNQEVRVWLADAEASGSWWIDSGYSVDVNSFTTNKFAISLCMPGLWKVRLQTGEEENAGVVLDDVSITPWEGVDRWGRDGVVSEYNNDWVYTKAWISAPADVTRNNSPYFFPDENIRLVGSDEYVFIFNEPGTYTFKPTSNIEIDRALVVGGGGSGGSGRGGGGGGGGVVEANWTDTPITVANGTILTITVGAGGAAPIPKYSYGYANSTSNPVGNNGGDSRLAGPTSVTLATAKGGGGGGSWSVAARSGGSGGGGSNSRTGAAGTSDQGFTGGSSNGGTGGGGGGAGGVGQDGTSSPNTSENTGRGGNGGDGKASDITGTIAYYGGGGGGGAGWVSTQTPGLGGRGGGGNGSRYQIEGDAEPGRDGFGGGGGGGTYFGNSSDAAAKKGAGAKGGCGCVILRVRMVSRKCVLQPSRGKNGYPMGLRSPYIDEGMSLFSYSYKDADTNCVMLVQIATNVLPTEGVSYVPGLTESLATNGSDQVWTTIARHEFKTMTPIERANGTMTTFINLRQHWINGMYTNVCGLIRVIVDPDIVSKVANAPWDKRDALVDYGKITITEVHCYNEPALDSRSWFGFNVHTEGWDGTGNAGNYAYLTDWPAGLSCALNFSARSADNHSAAALGIGLDETNPTEMAKYAQQNPFVQSAMLMNGIGTVNFRARLFDTNNTSAVITLYGGTDPSQDQVNTEGAYWHILTNFVVTSPTYKTFEWAHHMVNSPYKAIRLEMAGARWGRYPSAQARAWEWGDLDVRQEPINRVFIDDVSVSEVMLPPTFSVSLSPAGGSAVMSEADEGSTNSQINVRLSRAAGEPITVKLDIERTFVHSICSLPVLQPHAIDFAPGQKEACVNLTDLDGSEMSEFRILASVTNETVNADGVRWCDLYEPCELSISVVNSAPRILGSESGIAVSAIMRTPVSISWEAEDALADVTNGMYATIRTSDGVVTNFLMANATSAVFGWTNEVVFSTPGTKFVTVELVDKDGGMDMRKFYFDVQVPPLEIGVNFGGKTTSLSSDWIGRMMGLWAEWVENHQALAKSILEGTAANGRLSVVECYALGLDPENETDDFVITEFPMKADGTPDLAKLKYEPSEDRWTLPGLTARVFGASDLAGPWQEVRIGDEAQYRFFKVVIVAP